MLLISSSLSKLHKFKRSNYGFISWRKLCVMAAKCYYFGRIIMRIYEANYATRIYLCNPCKPWNRPYRPNPMNCLIRQQPLKTNPLRTSHVSACLGCKPGRNRQSRTMNRVNSAFFRLWFPQLSAEVTANCAPRVSRAFFIFIFKKNKISKIYVE